MYPDRQTLYTTGAVCKSVLINSAISRTRIHNRAARGPIVILSEAFVILS
jgi:hypothetical protein